MHTQVVDNVLKDHSANDQELYHRARGLLLLGAIFKSTAPDESDEERHEERAFFSSFPPCADALRLMHRVVAEAAKPKKSRVVRRKQGRKARMKRLDLMPNLLLLFFASFSIDVRRT
ncbi:hypothetical protein EDB84DRAFT_917826 [Lactarius hengduanensis]|nr:hypothetical protein EDB84DRAFT_917826 [Lactarius hengduanensis]